VPELSFAKIVQGRDSSVRVTDDGLADLVDLVMVVTAKNCNDSNELLRDLNPSLFDKEKILTRGRRRYVTLRNAIALIMVLPGKIAKDFRNQFAEIIENYIEKNMDSAGGSKQETEDMETKRKRVRREDLELIILEEEIKEKRASTQDKNIKNLENFMGLMTRIRPGWQQTDTRLRLQTEDAIKNIITTPLLLTNGGPPETVRPASLSISQLVQELGLKQLKHADACRVGALAAKRYRAIHKTEPPKHPQWVDGAERNVNSYSVEDREMLVSVLSDLGIMPSSAASSVVDDD
jgi:hypothetical protein